MGPGASGAAAAGGRTPGRTGCGASGQVGAGKFDIHFI